MILLDIAVAWYQRMIFRVRLASELLLKSLSQKGLASLTKKPSILQANCVYI